MKINIFRKLLTNVQIKAVLPEQFLEIPPVVFDFARDNNVIPKANLVNATKFSRHIAQILNEQGRNLGIGQYGEDRGIYQSPIYKTKVEARSVHLGIDLFVPVNTPIFAPLDGIIHSFQDNNHFLDYGPTIILEHNIKGGKFYTLYGHLSRTSLSKLKNGQKINAGDLFAKVGNQNENGNWPTHLHFQIITDMLGYSGDFPGVARPSEKRRYFAICPDPNLILRIL